MPDIALFNYVFSHLYALSTTTEMNRSIWECYPDLFTVLYPKVGLTVSEKKCFDTKSSEKELSQAAIYVHLACLHQYSSILWHLLFVI